MGRVEVSKAAQLTPVLEMTMVLGRLPITMCDPVAATKIANPPTKTDRQIAHRPNPKDHDVLSTEGGVMRQKQDDARS
jgi:hypothetical protein